MHIKFSKHGKGSGEKAVRYVMFDSQAVKKYVLDGNPNLFEAVADSLDFVHRYRSAIISWAPEDDPTPEQVRETLDRFYDVAFAGLDRDRFSPLAVLHSDADGKKDLHVLIPRVDLSTGKSFNPAPPGWQKMYDPCRDMLNYKHDWSRPDDPLRKRVVNLKVHEKIDRKTGKEQINAWLMQRIKAGIIQDRQAVIDSLSEIGEINRVGKDYVSVKLPDFEKPLRLKGGIYESGFDVVTWQKASSEITRGCGVSDAERRIRFADAQTEHTAVVERIGRFNQGRYVAAAQAVAGREREVAQAVAGATRADEQAFVKSLGDEASAYHGVGVVGDFGGGVVVDQSLREQNFGAAGDDRGSAEYFARTREQDLGIDSANVKSGGEVCDYGQEFKTGGGLDVGRQGSNQNRGEKVSDADRTAVDELVAQFTQIAATTERIIQRIKHIFNSANQWFSTHIGERENSTRSVGEASRSLESASANFERKISLKVEQMAQQKQHRSHDIDM